MTSPTRRTSSRWAALGLAEPRPGGFLPEEATVADWLASGLLADQWEGDPVEGMIESVRAEHLGMADVMPLDSAAVCVLRALAHRLAIASTLLAMADERQSAAEMPEGATEEGGEGA